MTTIRLPVIDDLSAERDTILRGKTPLFGGDDDESLACGRCGAVVVRRMSTRTLYRRTHSKSARLLLVCSCGAHNLLHVRQSPSLAQPVPPAPGGMLSPPARGKSMPPSDAAAIQEPT